MNDLFQNAFLYIIRKMCIMTIEVGPWRLEDVPDHFKTQEICVKAVKKIHAY